VNHRSSFRRLIRHWAVAAVCGVALSIAVIGCDKKPDSTANPSNNPNSNPPPAGGAHAIGVLDPGVMMTAMGWVSQKQSQADSFKNEIDRQVKVFGASLEKVVTDERTKMRDAAHLSTEQMDRLARGDLEKLPLSKEQRDEYVLVISRVNQLNQQLNQNLQVLGQRWQQEVDQMFTELARPAVRRAGQAQGVQVVLLSQQVFVQVEPSIDITNKVVDELQKSPPQPHFPTAPDLKLPNVTLGEMSSAATQPTIPNPTTKPSK